MHKHFDRLVHVWPDARLIHIIRRRCRKVLAPRVVNANRYLATLWHRISRVEDEVEEQLLELVEVRAHARVLVELEDEVDVLQIEYQLVDPGGYAPGDVGVGHRDVVDHDLGAAGAAPGLRAEGLGQGRMLPPVKRERLADDHDVGANALVSQGKKYPESSLIIGVPAKAKRETNEAEIEGIRKNAAEYVELAKEYRKASGK